MTHSLRRRLFVGTTLASAIVLAILCIVLSQAVARVLETKFDNVLLEKARSLASMVEQDEDRVHFDYDAAHFPEFEPGVRPAYFEIFLSGNRYKASPSLGANDLAAPRAPRRDFSTASPITLPNGQPGRLLAYPFQPFLERPRARERPASPPVTGLLWVAQDTGELTHTLAQIQWLTIGLCGAASLLSGLAMLAVVGRAMRPVQAVADQIETMDETDLTRRVRVDRVPVELGPVVVRLNGLLDRLRDAFTRERAFTADVAHELRTPLAALLATLEVCRARPRDGAGYEEAIDKCHAMLKQMEGMIEKLLLLARADSGQLTIKREPVDVAALLQECWCMLDARARRRGISLACTCGDALQVIGDSELLRIVFQNLLDNAVSYSGGENPELRCSRGPSAEGRVAIDIRNTGHALAPEDLPHLFERFWRKDAARSATGLHAGLGLSLSQRLLLLQQGSIHLRLDGHTFIARVELPAAKKSP